MFNSVYLVEYKKDGMPDYKEVHYEEFYPFIVSWANDQHRQNPEDFNATEYLSNQFNPFVRENIPPMLLSMSVTTVTEDVYTWVGAFGVGFWLWTGWNTYADIRARIYDVGGFSSVKISGPGGTVTFSSLHNSWYNTTIDVGFWEAATEYTITLKAKDNAGNELTYDYTVKGLFAGVLDFIKDIWDAVTSIVKAAWEAVKSAVDWIVEWLKTTVAELFNAVIAPIMEAIKNWVVGINKAMLAFFGELAKWNVIDGDESVENTTQAAIALMLSFIGMQDKAASLMAVLKEIMDFIAPFQEYISPFGLVGVLSNVLGNSVPAIGNFFDTLSNVGGQAIGTILKLLLGKDNSLLSLLGLTTLMIDTEGFPDVSFEGIKNFIHASPLKDNSMIKMFLIGVQEVMETYENKAKDDNQIRGALAAITSFMLLIISSMIIPILFFDFMAGIGGLFGLAFETVGAILTLFSMFPNTGLWGSIFTIGSFVIVLVGFVITMRSTEVEPYSKPVASLEMLIAVPSFLFSIMDI